MFARWKWGVAGGWLLGKGSRSLQIVAYSGKQFIGAFNKYFLSTCYVPSTVLDAETQQREKETEVSTP